MTPTERRAAIAAKLAELVALIEQIQAEETITMGEFRALFDVRCAECDLRGWANG